MTVIKFVIGDIRIYGADVRFSVRLSLKISHSKVSVSCIESTLRSILYNHWKLDSRNFNIWLQSWRNTLKAGWWLKRRVLISAAEEALIKTDGYRLHEEPKFPKVLSPEQRGIWSRRWSREGFWGGSSSFGLWTNFLLAQTPA